MPQADVTTLLSHDLLSQMFKRANQAVGRYIRWQLHAASSGISSSFTKWS